MKKTILFAGVIFGCLNASASIVTNWVYVVSNIFNNVYTENVITQKVKNSHTDYYFTNYVSVVTNVFQTTFTTNIDMTVVFDNFDPWVSAASNSAANASASAESAQTYSSQARTYANNAYSYQIGTMQSANSGLAQINDRIDWFVQHVNGMVTNVYIMTNLYYAIDLDARTGVATNADWISTLEDRVETLETDAYATDPAFGGVYVFVFTLNRVSWRFTVTIDTNSHGQEKTDSGIKYTVYYNSVSGSTNPCTVSGTRPSYLIIRKVLTGSNAGKLEVRYSTNGNTWSTIRTSDVETSPVVLPTSFGTNYGYLESYTNAKKPVYQWAKDKFDELWLFVTNAQNTVTSE